MIHPATDSVIAVMGIFTMTTVKPASSTLQALADEDLIALAQRGELDAFELIYERHKRAAYRLRAGSSAAMATQMTWCRRPSFRSGAR